jgi:hypothetical protein
MSDDDLLKKELAEYADEEADETSKLQEELDSLQEQHAAEQDDGAKQLIAHAIRKIQRKLGMTPSRFDKERKPASKPLVEKKDEKVREVTTEEEKEKHRVYQREWYAKRQRLNGKTVKPVKPAKNQVRKVGKPETELESTEVTASGTILKFKVVQHIEVKVGETEVVSE